LKIAVSDSTTWLDRSVRVGHVHDDYAVEWWPWKCKLYPTRTRYSFIDPLKVGNNPSSYPWVFMPKTMSPTNAVPDTWFYHLRHPFPS
jgi:hypothetical protein